VNPNIPVMTIPNEDQALDYIYENPKQGALYTIMCDVVARALDKIRELKEREEKKWRLQIRLKFFKTVWGRSAETLFLHSHF
jgi:hypothetical protein